MPTMQEAKSPSVVPQSEHELLKMEFDSVLGHPSAASHHEKTSVMLMTWDPQDDDLNVQEEVEELREVFETDYGFTTYQTQLTVQRPQQQALMELSRFVHSQDDDGTLLIIYYAGHGHGMNVEPGDMRLEGNRRPDVEQDEKKSVVWSAVEVAIRDTRADVLLIFDCCHTGLLCRPFRTAGLKSSFQFLGACTEDQTTQGPGKGSFTTALKWALRQLAKENRPFSSGELQKTITKYEHFPVGQQPVLSDRRDPYQNIVIAKQGSEPTAAEQTATSSRPLQQSERKEHIDVRFHFEHKVGPNHVRAAAEALKGLTKDEKMWSRVTFRGKSSVVQEVAEAWKQLAREKIAHRKSLSNITPIDTIGAPYSQLFSAPGLKPTLRLSIPDVPLTPATSIQPSGVVDFDRHNEQELQEQILHSRLRQLGDESIAFHLRSIAAKLRLMLSRFFSWMAHKVIPRSHYERLPDTEP